jgi:hypothetical protein
MDEHTLRPRMHPGIRPTRPLGHGGFWIEDPQGAPEIALAAPQRRLNLPAMESGPGIGHGEEEGMGHLPIIGPDRIEWPEGLRTARSTGICEIHGTYSQASAPVSLFHDFTDLPTTLVRIFL